MGHKNKDRHCDRRVAAGVSWNASETNLQFRMEGGLRRSAGYCSSRSKLLCSWRQPCRLVAPSAAFLQSIRMALGCSPLAAPLRLSIPSDAWVPMGAVCSDVKENHVAAFHAWANGFQNPHFKSHLLPQRVLRVRCPVRLPLVQGTLVGQTATTKAHAKMNVPLARPPCC